MEKTVCKICIMQKGLKGSDVFEGNCDYAFDNEEDFINHIEDYHHIKIKDRPPRKIFKEDNLKGGDKK